MQTRSTNQANIMSKFKQYFKSKSVINEKFSRNKSHNIFHLSSSILIVLTLIYYFTFFTVFCQSTQKATHVLPQNHQRFNNQQQASRYGGQSQYNHAIYVNPNPSPRSQGYQLVSAESAGSLVSNEHKKRGASQFDYIPTNTRAKGDPRQIGGSHSSPIGSLVDKRDPSQSAISEWPFVKSLNQLKTVRNNYKEQLGELQVATASSPSPISSPSASSSSSSSSKQSGSHENSSTHDSIKPPNSMSARLSETATSKTTLPADDSKSNWQFETTTAVPASSSTTTTTTAPTPTTENSNNEETASSSVAANQQETTTSAASLVESTKVDATTEATTTTTSPPPPTTTQPSRVTKTMQDPLFIPEFHSSIQRAVNNLVKMSTKSMSKSTTESPPMANIQPQSNGGRNYGLRSSLSLNVLLKNFGIHNLTNFDQILLKSSLRNDTKLNGANRDKEALNFSDKKIEINGFYNMTELDDKPNDIKVNTAINGETNIDSNSNSNDNEQADNIEQAECKIEYTMKHVNITLLNGSKRDYTCDYIIDRKLASNSLAKPATSLDISKVCKLQLTSRFFSNQIEQQQQQKSNQPSSLACNGTYLSVGQLKFCYLKRFDSKERLESTLNRVFDFPIEFDAFDIRVVHKHAATNTNEVESGDEFDNEIHLEIKPLVDDECNVSSTSLTSDRSNSKNQQESGTQSRPRKASLDATTTTTTTTTTSTTPPPPVTTHVVAQPSSSRASGGVRELRLKSNPSAPLDERSEHRVITTFSGPRRKFVIKLPQDKQLHPLNNRFKVSQSFDINTTPHLYNTQAASSGDKPNSPPRTSQYNNNQLELCDGIKHSSISGQISSPDYPRYYAANIDCSFIIKRNSNNFCQVLLHFRDFDLINQSQQNDANAQTTDIANNCLNDYLLIGETKYCNRYAMIGHKMKLDFPVSNQLNPTINFTFRSDHMRSGRGFLIKYQQLACQGELLKFSAPVSIGKHEFLSHSNQHRQTTEQPTTLIGGNYAPLVHDHTIAPPMQQPDFSLALKTTPPPPPPLSQTVDESDKPKSSSKTSTTPNEVRAQQNQIKFNEKSMMSTGNSIKPEHSFHDSDGADQAVGKSASTTLSKNNNTNTAVSSGSLTPMASTVSSAISFSQPTQQTTIGSEQQHSPQTTTRLMDKRSTQCNQVKNELNFILTNPNYPENYENNLECMYYIRQNSSQVCYIEVTFIKFDLEADKDCRYDYVEINNVRLCGSLQDFPYKTTRIYLFNEPLKIIKFKSDNSGTKSGFLMRVEQLKCAPNGTILRQSKALDIIVTEPGNDYEGRSALSRTSQATIEKLPVLPNNASPISKSTSIITPLKNSSRTFEYDSQFSRWSSSSSSQLNKLDNNNTNLKPNNNSNSSSIAQATSTQRIQPQPQQQQPTLLTANNEPKSNSISSSCDDLFYGKEVIIKSPFWPDSYNVDESIGLCRYTIVRDLTGRNKICQLELRFVNLRLGASDCIDIDGYEVLCGFNTRNMVKYYPFDRQSHLTITFFTGTSKFSSARSIFSSSADSSSDLLPVRAPLRFMIIVKQHECIDGFLAPQIELEGYNQTNLLYSNTPRYVNKTSAVISSSSASQTLTGKTGAGGSTSSALNSRMSTSQRGPLESSSNSNANNNNNNNNSADSSSILKYDFSSSSVSSTQANQKQQPSDSSTINYSTTSTTNADQSPQTNVNKNLPLGSVDSKQETRKLNSNLANPQPVCFDNSVIKTDDQIFSANYPLNYYENSHCAFSMVRKSENFCFLQLEIIDLDLNSRSKFCESDYIQFNYGERYCNLEQVESRLNNTGKLVLPFDKSNDFRSSIVFHSNKPVSRRGFLLRYKQLECPSSSSSSSLATFTTNTGIQASNLTDEFKLIDRVPLNAPISRQSLTNTVQSSPQNFDSSLESQNQKCQIQFAQYNGIMSSNNILSKLRINYPFKHDCEIKLKLLPGFCHVLLTFGEFELNQRYKGYCLEYLELDGVQYCGRELKNTNQTLPITDLTHRTINLKYSTTNTSNVFGFRAIFKQLECNPEPLKTLAELSPPTHSPSSTNNQQQQQQASISNQNSEKSKSEMSGLGGKSSLDKVDFKEIVLRSEFFELNSAKLSTLNNNRQTYEPNMFVVYRIKKLNTDVCKIRLMFYRFDLEASTGCGRDFLDINNEDRLCGQLGKPENTRRDYEWSSSDRDFLISFVSDSSIEQEGFLIFGQQVQTNCTSNRSSPPMATATFDEELNKQPEQVKSKSMVPPPVSNKQPTSGEGQQIATTKIPSSSSISNNNDDDNGGKCFSLHYEKKFELSSENWPQKYSTKTTCYYLIHKSESNICSVTFNLLSMILGPEESESISDCNSSGRDYLAIDNQTLCGFISKPRVISVDFDKRQFISAKFNSITGNGFGFFIEVKQNKCEEAAASVGQSIDHSKPPISSTQSSQTTSPPLPLEPTSNNENDNNNNNDSSDNNNYRLSSAKRVPGEQQETNVESCNQLITSEVGFIESDNFPNHYRHNLDCLYAIRRTNQSICAIDIVMNHFDLEDQSNSSAVCENDFLEIDYTRFCGYYPLRHKLRFNFFGDELDKLIKFHSDAALSRTGFSLTISQSSECSSMAREASLPGSGNSRQYDSTSSSSPTAAAQDDEVINYLPTNNSDSPTSSSRIDVGNINNSSSSAGQKFQGSDAGNSEAEHPSSSKQKLQLANNTTSSFVSNEPFRSKEFNTLCQFIYHKEQQYLLSPNYNEQKKSYDNNMDCLYKIVAKGYEFCSLKLVIVDLDLESSSDCHNDYLLIDNQRYCGRNLKVGNNGNRNISAAAAAEQQVIEVQFADLLPREIDLLYHTNAHANEGRGFKLFYEQKLCETYGDQNFKLQNGDLRLNFRQRESPNQSENLQLSNRQTNLETRDARRLKFGQLNYPKNYITSSLLDTNSNNNNRQQSHSTPSSKHNRQKESRHDLGSLSIVSSSLDKDRLQAIQVQPSNHRRDSWRDTKPQIIPTATTTPTTTTTQTSGLGTNKQRDTRGEDLDEMHDDLTLRKEIVVTKLGPAIMTH